MPKSLPDAQFDRTPYGGDGWTLSAPESTLGLDQTPAVLTIGNGFIGVRGPGEAPDAPRVFLNSVFDVTPITYHEGAHGFPRASDTRYGVADATGIVIEAGGVDAGDGLGRTRFALRGAPRTARGGRRLPQPIETLVAMDPAAASSRRASSSLARAARVCARP